jgi:holliday junction DNA helicase RuvA
MIGRLRGKIIEKNPPEILLEVQGVGYELQVPMTTCYQLTDIDSEITFYTHLSIREDAHQLYGFLSKQARSLFRTLLKVNGIGAKSALAILSSMTPQEFTQAIWDKNMQALVKLPGIGKKTAERLMIEMRDRLEDCGMEGAISMSLLDKSLNTGDKTCLHEAISALVALGYKPQDAQKMVESIAEPQMNSETLIRQALRALA